MRGSKNPGFVEVTQIPILTSDRVLEVTVAKSATVADPRVYTPWRIAVAGVK